MLDFLKGKKTYIVVGMFTVLAVLVALNNPIPEYVFALLGALGLGALRLALADVSGNKGWKSFAAAGAVVAIAVLQALGVVLPYEAIYAVLGALGVAGVRDAVGKLV
jgi:hypothetical protein